MDQKIAVFDSGVGGLAVLKQAKKALPNEDFLYFADNRNAPYGNKTANEICTLVCDRVDKILCAKPKAVVIACNTATSTCMHKLVERYPKTLFVGTLPVVDKVAKPCLVFVTKGTAESSFGVQVAKQKDVYLFELQKGAKMIEDCCTDNEFKQYLDDMLGGINLFAFKSMVLGCTHFIHKKHVFASFGLPVYDNAKKVADDLKKSLEQKGLAKKHGPKGSVTFALTDNGEQQFKKYIGFFNKL